MRSEVRLPNGQVAIIPHLGLAENRPLVDGDVRKLQPCQEGWGDLIQQKLARIGVTKDWYLGIKEKFGLPPTCGCDGRKEWLNKVSDWWRAERK